MDNLDPRVAFRVNTPRVVHQTIDGETVIIDFDTGAYFSTDGTGAAIWEEIARNSTCGDVVELLSARYAGQRADIERAVADFLKELEGESLVVPCEPGSAAGPHALPHAPDPAALPAFRAPVLRKYTDMQELLLLDPIHEVDEQGWPVKKDSSPE